MPRGVKKIVAVKAQLVASNNVAYKEAAEDLDDSPPGAPTPALQHSLESLISLVSAAHYKLTGLVNTLQPFLPQHMFDDQEGSIGEEDGNFVGYSESGNGLSPTLIAVNKSLNELQRLNDRIDYVRNQVVL